MNSKIPPFKKNIGRKKQHSFPSNKFKLSKYNSMKFNYPGIGTQFGSVVSVIVTYQQKTLQLYLIGLADAHLALQQGLCIQR